MSSKIIIPFAVATMACLGAVAVSSAPASAYDGGGYCYYHPHDPVCLAGVVAPYLHHHGEYYDHDHYHDHDHDHHHHHDHDHDHDHDHHHDHHHHD